jgi:hypothetical protein
MRRAALIPIASVALLLAMTGAGRCGAMEDEMKMMQGASTAGRISKNSVGNGAAADTMAWNLYDASQPAQVDRQARHRQVFEKILRGHADDPRCATGPCRPPVARHESANAYTRYTQPPLSPAPTPDPTFSATSNAADANDMVNDLMATTPAGRH